MAVRRFEIELEIDAQQETMVKSMTPERQTEYFRGVFESLNKPPQPPQLYPNWGSAFFIKLIEK